MFDVELLKIVIHFHSINLLLDKNKSVYFYKLSSRLSLKMK